MFRTPLILDDQIQSGYLLLQEHIQNSGLSLSPTWHFFFRLQPVS